MIDPIRLGPFVLTFERLLFVGAIAAFFLVSALLLRKKEIPRYWDLAALVAALLVGRLVYVVANWSAFSPRPLSVFAVWQGGLNPVAALLAGAACAALFFRRRVHLLTRPIVAVAAAAVVWLVPNAVARGFSSTVDGPALPSAVIANLEGAEIALQSNGKPVVLNLWATWCPPCRRELPMLTEIATANSSDVTSYFVSQGEDPEAVENYIQSESIDGRYIYVDQAARLSAILKVQALPTTLFFAADGSFADGHVGEISAARVLQGVARARGSD